MGPLPFSLPGALYGGGAYVKSAHAEVLDEAVALIPEGAVVSVNNNVGAQLAARRVSYVFPYYEGADWVVVDQRRPFVYDRENPRLHQLVLMRLAIDTRFRSVFAEDGVHVFRRVGSRPPTTPN